MSLSLIAGYLLKLYISTCTYFRKVLLYYVSVWLFQKTFRITYSCHQFFPDLLSQPHINLAFLFYYFLLTLEEHFKFVRSKVEKGRDSGLLIVYMPVTSPDFNGQFQFNCHTDGPN